MDDMFSTLAGMSGTSALPSVPPNTDWTSMYIGNETTKEDGLKVMEAMGFHIVWRGYDTERKQECIIFHNLRTNAMARCNALEDNICYGGFEMLIGHRLARKLSLYDHIDMRSIPIDKSNPELGCIYVTKLNANNELVYEYNKCLALAPIENIKRLGYDPSYGILMPDVFDEKLILLHKNYKHPDLSWMFHSNAYDIPRILNRMYVAKMYKDLEESGDIEGKDLYREFMDDYWSNVLSCVNIQYSPEEYSRSVGAALRIANVPEEQIEWCYQTAWLICDEYDSNNEYDERKAASILASYHDDFCGTSETVNKILDEFDFTNYRDMLNMEGLL